MASDPKHFKFGNNQQSPNRNQIQPGEYPSQPQPREKSPFQSPPRPEAPPRHPKLESAAIEESPQKQVKRPLSPYTNGRRNQDYVNPSFISNDIFKQLQDPNPNGASSSSSKTPKSTSPIKPPRDQQRSQENQRAGSPINGRNYKREESNIAILLGQNDLGLNKSPERANDGRRTPRKDVSPVNPRTPEKQKPRDLHLDDESNSTPKERDRTPTRRDELTPTRKDELTPTRREATPTRREGERTPGKRLATPNTREYDIINHTPRAEKSPVPNPEKDNAKNIGSLTPHSHSSVGDDLLCPDCVNKYLMDQKKKQAEKEREAEKRLIEKVRNEEMKEKEAQQKMDEMRREGKKKEAELLKKLANEKHQERLKQSKPSPHEHITPAGPFSGENSRQLEEMNAAKRKQLRKMLKEQIREKEKLAQKEKEREKNLPDQPMEFGNEYKNIFEGQHAAFQDALKNQIENIKKKKEQEKEADKKLIEEEVKANEVAEREMREKARKQDEKQKELLQRQLQDALNEKAKRLVSSHSLNRISNSLKLRDSES